MMNEILNEKINKYNNYSYDEKKYDKMRKKYFYKFYEFPPVIIGIGQKHPIYMFLIENALETGKEIDDKDLDEAIRIFNIYDNDKEY